MANDEREEERDFLAGLKTRTGRDLAEWMAAIAAQGFQDKNEIIDWLRTQGLPFARASWLERIHRNGGKPIHTATPPVAPVADMRAAPPPRLVVVAPARRPAPARVPQEPAPQPARPQPALHVVAPQPPAASPARTAPPPVPHPTGAAAGVDLAGPTPAQPPDKAGGRPGKKATKPPPRVEPSADPAALEKLVAAAKGYRPLYHHLEAQIRRAIPGAVIAARDRYVAIGAPLEFAAVTLHPTDIRLGLALGDRAFDAALQAAKMRGPGPAITHMVVLTDARQVNDDLLAQIKAAHARVNTTERAAQG